jgi:hypothetical protein
MGAGLLEAFMFQNISNKLHCTLQYVLTNLTELLMLSQLLISLAQPIPSKTDWSPFLTVCCQSPSTRYHHRDHLLTLKCPVQIPWRWPWSQPNRMLRYLSVCLPAAVAAPKLLCDYWHHLLCRPRGNYCCCESVDVSVLLSWSCRNSHSAPWPKINILITKLPDLAHKPSLLPSAIVEIAEGSRDGLACARCCNYSCMCSSGWVE